MNIVVLKDPLSIKGFIFKKDRLKKVIVEDRLEETLVGNIYRGKVVKVIERVGYIVNIGIEIFLPSRDDNSYDLGEYTIVKIQRDSDGEKRPMGDDRLEEEEYRDELLKNKETLKDGCGLLKLSQGEIINYIKTLKGRLWIDLDHRYYKNNQEFFDAKVEQSVRTYKNANKLREKYKINSILKRLTKREISLRSGGSIVIDRCEGMSVIDINTSLSKGKDSINKTNIEGLYEVFDQIKGRNIGGNIVVDLINERDDKNRKNLDELVKKLASYDDVNIQVDRISRFWILEIVREKKGVDIEKYYKEKNISRSNENKSLIWSLDEILESLNERDIRDEVDRIDLYLKKEKVEVYNRFYSEYVREYIKKSGKTLNVEVDDSIIKENYRVEYIKGSKS